jgi:hypothetical protein
MLQNPVSHEDDISSGGGLVILDVTENFREEMPLVEYVVKSVLCQYRTLALNDIKDYHLISFWDWTSDMRRRRPDVVARCATEFRFSARPVPGRYRRVSKTAFALLRHNRLYGQQVLLDAPVGAPVGGEEEEQNNAAL